MNDPLYHLPFALVLFIILITGFTDLAVGTETRVLVTLLAPALWLGLYVLGRTRAQDENRSNASQANAKAK